MDETARLILWLALAGTAVTFAGSAAIWFMDEERRIRRAFRHVLTVPADAMITAHGRGVGFSFSRSLAAVAWDQGAWCLVYRIEELVGAELIIDGEVCARVYRGEPRRPLEQRTAPLGPVLLRFIFDDARHPDFELTLWLPGDEARRNAPSPAQTIQEANRWITRMEAILRRAAPAHAPPPQTGLAPVAEAPRLTRAADTPPWDDVQEETPPAAVPREPRKAPRTPDLFDEDEPEDGLY